MNDARSKSRPNGHRIRAMVVGLLATMAAGCSSTDKAGPPPLDVSTRVETATGPVVGYVSDRGVKTWLGIPYAQPPVGDLRWRPTRPVHAWSEPLASNEHPEWCTQVTTALDELEGIDKGQILGSEDCLYLSIYAPADATPNSALPVMFWIHGGSNMWGRAEQYDPSELARRENVVVVVAQYRVGPLGYFQHPALRDEADGVAAGAANFAVLDLIEALRWTRSNAGVFGGDSDNVTIFGESAGGQNVYALIVSPLSEGLFDKAITQSGIPQSTPVQWAMEGHEGVENPYPEAAKKITGSREPTARQLRSVSAEKIWQAYLSDGEREGSPTMVDDGVTIPADGIRASLARSLVARDIPIIMGSNEEEAKYLLAFDPEYTKKRLGFIITPRDRDLYDAASEYLSGAWRATTINAPARDVVRAGAGEVYSYRFDWDGQGSYWFSDVSYLLGSSHMVEIPFVFGMFDNFLGSLGGMMFQSDTSDDRAVLSREMMHYWGNFARTGAPGDTPAAWPALTPETAQRTMIFDTPDDEGTRLGTDATTVDQIIEAVRTDPRLDADGRRCKIAASLGHIFGPAEPRFAALADSVCGMSQDR